MGYSDNRAENDSNIFTKQKYVRRNWSCVVCFGGGGGNIIGVKVWGGGRVQMGLYLGQRGLFCFRRSHLTNDGGFLHFSM